MCAWLVVLVLLISRGRARTCVVTGWLLDCSATWTMSHKGTSIVSNASAIGESTQLCECERYCDLTSVAYTRAHVHANKQRGLLGCDHHAAEDKKKKRKSVDSSLVGEAQLKGDFSIKPESTPELDTSQWPLLLKVSHSLDLSTLISLSLSLSRVLVCGFD